jgi:hypothetical protein
VHARRVAARERQGRRERIREPQERER